MDSGNPLVSFFEGSPISARLSIIKSQVEENRRKIRCCSPARGCDSPRGPRISTGALPLPQGARTPRNGRPYHTGKQTSDGETWEWKVANTRRDQLWHHEETLIGLVRDVPSLRAIKQHYGVKRIECLNLLVAGIIDANNQMTRAATALQVPHHQSFYSACGVCFLMSWVAALYCSW